jgi:hypothetical protein
MEVNDMVLCLVVEFRHIDSSLDILVHLQLLGHSVNMCVIREHYKNDNHSDQVEHLMFDQMDECETWVMKHEV